MALLASAPTLEKLSESITCFYAGEEKEIVPESDGIWRVCFKDNGMPMIGVRVRLYRNRYRFETIL